MSREEIRKKTWAIVRKISPLAPREPAAERTVLSQNDTDMIDSVAALQLVLALEQEFGITVEDADISTANFGDLASLCRYIENRLPRS